MLELEGTGFFRKKITILKKKKISFNIPIRRETMRSNPTSVKKNQTKPL